VIRFVKLKTFFSQCPTPPLFFAADETNEQTNAAGAVELIGQCAPLSVRLLIALL
jgi:hypothetical protein